MAVNKTSYPSTSTVALTCTIAALASDTGLVIGRASTAIDNTTNLDLDHLVSGSFTAGTTPTAAIIEVWAYAPRSSAASVGTYADSITGTDAAKTMSSLNVKYAALRLVASIATDATSGRVYDFPPTSIAGLFGSSMPQLWGIFVVHNCVVALAAGACQYLRIQTTTV